MPAQRSTDHLALYEGDGHYERTQTRQHGYPRAGKDLCNLHQDVRLGHRDQHSDPDIHGAFQRVTLKAAPIGRGAFLGP